MSEVAQQQVRDEFLERYAKDIEVFLEGKCASLREQHVERARGLGIPVEGIEKAWRTAESKRKQALLEKLIGKPKPEFRRMPWDTERDFAVKMDKALERIARTNGGRTLLPPQFDDGPVIEGEIVKEG